MNIKGECRKQTLTQTNGEQSKQEEPQTDSSRRSGPTTSQKERSRAVRTRRRVSLRRQASAGCTGPARVDSVVSLVRRAGTGVERVEKEGRTLPSVSESRTCGCPPSASRRCPTALRATGRVRTDAGAQRVRAHLRDEAHDARATTYPSIVGSRA